MVNQRAPGPHGLRMSRAFRGRVRHCVGVVAAVERGFNASGVNITADLCSTQREGG